MDQLPRLGKRELICLIAFTCNYVVSVRRGFHFLWVLGMGCVISLWHSPSLPYTCFDYLNLKNSLNLAVFDNYKHLNVNAQLRILRMIQIFYNVTITETYPFKSDPRFPPNI